jgi:hypothetical protein
MRVNTNIPLKKLFEKESALFFEEIFRKVTQNNLCRKNMKTKITVILFTLLLAISCTSVFKKSNKIVVVNANARFVSSNANNQNSSSSNSSVNTITSTNQSSEKSSVTNSAPKNAVSASNK